MTDWNEIHPHSEFYLFVPRDETLLAQYNKFLKITDIFPVSSTGIKTHRDHFVVDFNKETLKRRIRTFLDPSLPDDFVRETFKLKDTYSWKLAEKRKKLQQDKEWEKRIVPCLYRPFDVRWLFYHRDAIDRGREEVMRHILQDNLCLCSGRAGQVVGGEAPWNLAFCSNSVQDHNMFYRGGVITFPLFLYPSTSKNTLFSGLDSPSEKVTNLNLTLLTTVRKAHGDRPTPEVSFYYIYATIYSNVYREKYAEFLRIDFPRIPFTSDHELFDELAALGKRLVNLHLLRSDELDPPIAKFEGDGDGIVQTGKNGLCYDPETERVFINETQCFKGLPPQVWEYQIGGYQVCDKWLKDRKGRRLNLDEIKTYCQIVTALAKTIEIQAEIDEFYPMVEETLLAISSD